MQKWKEDWNGLVFHNNLLFTTNESSLEFHSGQVHKKKLSLFFAKNVNKMHWKNVKLIIFNELLYIVSEQNWHFEH